MKCHQNARAPARIKFIFMCASRLSSRDLGWNYGVDRGYFTGFHSDLTKLRSRLNTQKVVCAAL